MNVSANLILTKIAKIVKKGLNMTARRTAACVRNISVKKNGQGINATFALYNSR